MLVAFDLLYLNGHDLRKLALTDKAQKKIMGGTDIHSDSFEVDGPEMYAHACKVGLEGVISKVRDSRYTSGKINERVKKTCSQRETLMVAVAHNGNDWDGIYPQGLGDLIYARSITASTR